MCEARAIDAIVAFGSNAEAAKRVGVALGTFQNQLHKAYEVMASYGEDFSAEPRARRVEVITLWLLYWWSDEGKASLRKTSLTRPALA